jgi:hypothetical protein
MAIDKHIIITPRRVIIKPPGTTWARKPKATARGIETARTFLDMLISTSFRRRYPVRALPNPNNSVDRAMKIASTGNILTPATTGNKRIKIGVKKTAPSMLELVAMRQTQKAVGSIHQNSNI